MIFEENTIAEVKECKGQTFKGYSSTFFDRLTKRIERKEGIRLLNKKSCPGCQKCHFFFDDILDMIDSEGLIFPDQGIENGKLYTITVTNIERDWETGIVDGWTFEIMEVKNGKSTTGLDYEG